MLLDFSTSQFRHLVQHSSKMKFSIVNEAQRDTLARVGGRGECDLWPDIGLISWALLLAVTLASCLSSITLRWSSNPHLHPGSSEIWNNKEQVSFNKSWEPAANTWKKTCFLIYKMGMQLVSATKCDDIKQNSHCKIVSTKITL